VRLCARGMPRQGARRKARLAGASDGRKATGKKGRRRGEGEEEEEGTAAAEDKRPKATRASATSLANAVDFEAALRAPGDTAEKLFELANKPAVRFSIAGGYVQVAQDRSTTEHSGGVVWETAFFLARYLEQHVLPERRPNGDRRLRVVELGSGCGLLGLALARLDCKVTLTEQPAAMGNLKANVAAHKAASGGGLPKAMQLSWGEEADIAAVSARGPFDLVVASDVVFATRFVEPLLRSVAALLSARAGEAEGAVPECWLCLQQRDPDSHRELLEQAPSLFRVAELNFEGLPGFEAAVELECLLLRLRLQKRRREDSGKGAAAPAAEKVEAEAEAEGPAAPPKKSRAEQTR